jgi:3-hydroxyacyl-CoA dehydrogenase
VFAQVEAVVSAECVLMTNTSSLSVSAMAADLEHPERVVGFHFFNPVAVMPLVEVIKAERTADDVLATAFEAGKKLRKSCVLVDDAAGFVVNRLLLRFMCEVFAIVDDGTAPDVADRAALRLGLPMSPFALLELVGPAVALHVAERLNTAFGDRFVVSSTLRKIVEAGRRGLWSWDERRNPYLDDEAAALLPGGGVALTEEQVLDRIVEALASETRLMLDEGVVAAPEDVDLCMILGAGWPFHLGGITPYLDRTGASVRVTGQPFHQSPHSP